MSLELVILKQPPSADIPEPRKMFREQGGTIGRASDNAWVLPDPDRFVSSRHATISYEHGDYVLTDTSTNGVYHNGSHEPLGTGNQVKLADGDILTFGEYEIRVDIFGENDLMGAGGEAAPTPSNKAMDFDQWLDEPQPQQPQYDSWSSPKPAGGDPSSSLDDLLGSGAQGVVGEDSLLSSDPASLDPLAALDKASGAHELPVEKDDLSWLQPGKAKQQRDSDFDSMGDNVPADAQRMDVPRPVQDPDLPPPNRASTIPEDWDDLLEGIEPSEGAHLQVNKQVEPEPPLPEGVTKPSTDDIPPEYDRLIEPKPDDPLAYEKKKMAQENAKLDDLLGGLNKPSQQKNDAVDEKAQVKQAKPVQPKQPPKPKVEVKPEAAQKPVPPKLKATPMSGTDAEQLLQLLGLNPDLVPEEIKHDLLPITADIVKNCLAGLMQLLIARSTIKNELRMAMTTIQPKENNPLKFSVSAQEALENMLIKQNGAYMQPMEAIRDAYDDLSQHQLAVIAGMRAAFNHLMARFDPDLLEQRFDKEKTSGSLLASKKGKYWDKYIEFYRNVVSQSDDSFQNLFGDDFSEAYEEQLRQLKSTKR